MPRRGERKPRVGASDVGSLRWWSAQHLEWLRTRNYSASTIEMREGKLALFNAWCSTRAITRPAEVTRAILEAYQRHLFYLRKDNGRALSFASQRARVAPLRAFFRWLTRQNVIPSNPAGELEMPRLEHRLPRHVLSVSEAERVLLQPDVHEPLGLRDRAILEVLYSTGMRRMEIAELRLDSIDPERGTVLIRLGKGKKDRMIPIGDRAAAWVDKYISDARPLLLVPPDEGVLFLTQMGDPFTPNRLSKMVKDYVVAANLGKTGACHLFRHTMATVMLDGGADIRYIQEMLWHADLSTTQIYTRVSVRRLKEVHAKTHPGARLGGEHLEGDDRDEE